MVISSREDLRPVSCKGCGCPVSACAELGKYRSQAGDL